MEQALSELRAMQAAGCVLLGEPAYYGRFGFPGPCGPATAGRAARLFLALAFHGPVPEGIAQYSDAFNAAA
jgi:putative acetyltransferase